MKKRWNLRQILNFLVAYIFFAVVTPAVENWLLTDAPDEVPVVDASTGPLRAVFERADSATYRIKALNRATSLHQEKKFFVTRVYLASKVEESAEPVVSSIDTLLPAFLNGSNSPSVALKPTLKKCSHWLDICIVSYSQDSVNMQAEYRKVTAPANAGEEVYLLPYDEHFKKNSTHLITGKISSIHEPFASLQISARPEYIGSPLFNRDGKIVGYLTENEWEGIVGMLTNSAMDDSPDAYISGFGMVTTQAISASLWCLGDDGLSMNKLECLTRNLELFVAEGEYSVQHRKNHMQKINFVSRSGKFLRDWESASTGIYPHSEESFSLSQSIIAAGSGEFQQVTPGPYQNRSQTLCVLKAQAILLSSSTVWPSDPDVEALKLSFETRLYPPASFHQLNPNELQVLISFSEEFYSFYHSDWLFKFFIYSGKVLAELWLSL